MLLASIIIKEKITVLSWCKCNIFKCHLHGHKRKRSVILFVLLRSNIIFLNVIDKVIKGKSLLY